MLVNAAATGPTTAAPAPGIGQAIAAGGAGSAGVVGQDFQSHWQIESYPAVALSQTADTQLMSGVGTGSASVADQDLQEHWQSQWHPADSGGLVDPAPAGGQELAAATSLSPLPVLDPRAVDQLDLAAVVEQELGQA
jgi:hypothetical protein